jgi:hypothetical protein
VEAERARNASSSDSGESDESDTATDSTSLSESESDSLDSEDSSVSESEDDHGAKPRDDVKTEVSGRQWNEEFQSLCEPLLGDDPAAVLERSYAIYTLFLYLPFSNPARSLLLYSRQMYGCREFQETASEIGKAIINESTFLSPPRSTCRCRQE